MSECAARHRRRTLGFTLLEVLVAMSIGAIVVLAARALTERVAEGGRAVGSHMNRRLHAEASERLLRSLVSQIEAAPDSTLPQNGAFVGTPDVAEFSTWCLQPSGWEEQCRVRLVILSSPVKAVLRLEARSLGVVVLDSFAKPAELRYLLDPGAGGKWLKKWSPAPYPPFAIGIVVAADTTVLRIATRD